MERVLFFKKLSSCEVGIVCPAVERGAKSFLLIAAEMAPGNVEETVMMVIKNDLEWSRQAAGS